MNYPITGITVLDILLVGVSAIAILLGIIGVGAGAMVLTYEGLDRHPNITMLAIVIIAALVLGLGLQTLDLDRKV